MREKEAWSVQTFSGTWLHKELMIEQTVLQRVGKERRKITFCVTRALFTVFLKFSFELVAGLWIVGGG